MRWTFVSLGFVLLARVLVAQSADAPQTLTEAEARQHIVQQTEPVYPPIAKAAQIQGDVVLTVSIDATGKVTAEKVVSGPAMLQQAALDAVKTWRFSPFVAQGVPVASTTRLTIPFHIHHDGPTPTKEQEEAAQAMFPLEDSCRGALKAQKMQDAVTFCKQAVDMSLKAGDLTSSDQLGRMDAYQLYGHALLATGQLKPALEEENLAVAEAKKCVTEKDQEYAMPFFWRAMVEAHLGQTDAAQADFVVAEETHRRAIKNLPDMKQRYGLVLAAILLQHAQLMDLLGKPDDAAKLRAEAKGL